MKKFFFIVTIIFAYLFVHSGQFKAQAQTRVYAAPAHCLRMVYPDSVGTGYHNPDSVRVDSCPDSHTYKQWYAKKYILVMDKYIFKQKPIQYDSIYSYLDIDSVYQTNKQEFINLEKLLGTFKIKRDNNSGDDSLLYANTILDIILNDYNSVDSVYYYVYKTSNVKVFTINRSPSLDYVNDNFKNIENKFYARDGLLKITLKQSVIPVQYEIFDLTGNLVSKNVIQTKNDSEEFHINISYLENGVYFIVRNGTSQIFMIYK